MNKRFRIAVKSTIVIVVLLSACGPTPQTPPSGDNAFQVTNIDAGDTTQHQISQTKVFDQCQSASPLNAQISFNDIASSETGEQLVLGASLGGEYGLSQVAKVNIQGSIQQYYSSTQGQSFGHQESINIQVPAGTKQEYTIIWTEYRQQGTVSYSDNGQEKSIDYDYRQGVELTSSSVSNLDCPGDNEPENLPVVQEPEAPATEVVVPTLAPLFPLSNNGVATGDGLTLSATVDCLANCGNPTFPDFDALFTVHYKLKNTTQQMIIIPDFGGDESYIALNTGQRLYVWTSIGWCDRENFIDSQSIGPGETIDWSWDYKLKNDECGGYGSMLALPDGADSFTIVFPAIGERFSGANWAGSIPR